MADKTVAIVSDGHGAENLVSLVRALAMIRDLRAALEPFANLRSGDIAGRKYAVDWTEHRTDFELTGEQLMTAREVYARTGAAAK